MTREEAGAILRWHAKWSPNAAGPAQDCQFMEALRIWMGVELALVEERLQGLEEIVRRSKEGGT